MSLASVDSQEKTWSVRCNKHFMFTSAIRRLYKFLTQRLDPEYFEIIPFQTLTFELLRWKEGERSSVSDPMFTLLKKNSRSFVTTFRGVKASSTALHISLFFEDTRDAVFFHSLQAKCSQLLSEYGTAGHSALFHSLPIVRFKNTHSAKQLPSIEQWEECDFGELRMNEWRICREGLPFYRIPCQQFVCHRGNLESKFVPDENRPDILDRRIRDGFGVELDVWCSEDQYWLGHDEPQYEVSFDWLMKDGAKKYIHCKDGPTFEHLLLQCGREGYNPHLFYHTKEDYALTTRGHVIVHPGVHLLDCSINMMPEMGAEKPWGEYYRAFAVCSDTIRNLRE